MFNSAEWIGLRGLFLLQGNHQDPANAIDPISSFDFVYAHLPPDPDRSSDPVNDVLQPLYSMTNLLRLAFFDVTELRETLYRLQGKIVIVPPARSIIQTLDHSGNHSHQAAKVLQILFQGAM